MPNKDPRKVAEHWVKQMTNSGERVKDGISRVAEAPSQGAIRAIPKMVKRLQEAADNGKIKRGLEKVSLSDWQNLMLEKGVERMGGGARAAENKMAQFMTEWLPEADRLSQMAKKMPKETIEDSIAIVGKVIRAAKDWGKKRR